MLLPGVSAPYRGLDRQVFLLFLANAVYSLGNFVWPLMALLLTDRLGLSKTGAGYFVTLTMLAVVPGALAGGKLADRWGHKEVFVASRILATIVVGFSAFGSRSPVAPLLLPWLLVVASGLRGASEPSVSALVADLSRGRERQAAFSLIYLGSRVGFAAPLLAGLLYRNHLPWVFLGQAATTLCSALLVGLFLGRVRPPSPPGCAGAGLPLEERSEEGGVLSTLLRRPALLALSLILIVYSLVHAQHLFGLPIQVNERFGSAGSRLYGLLISLNALTVLALTPMVTHLTSRLPATSSLSLGGLLYAVGFGMLSFAGGLAWFVASTVLWTLGEVVVVTNSQVYLNSHTPASHRGRFNAVVPLVSQAGYLIGPWLAGRLIDRSGVAAVWPWSFFLALAGAALAHITADGGKRAWWQRP